MRERRAQHNRLLNEPLPNHNTEYLFLQKKTTQKPNEIWLVLKDHKNEKVLSLAFTHAAKGIWATFAGMVTGRGRIKSADIGATFAGMVMGRGKLKGGKPPPSKI